MKNIFRPILLVVRKHSGVIFPLILLLTSQLVASEALYDSKKFMFEKYSGKYEDLASKGYTQENSLGLGVSRKPEGSAFAVCRPFNKTKSFDCVFAINEILGHEASGRAIKTIPSEMIHVRLPKGWDYFSTASTECKSAKYQGSEIVAIGRWRWQKKPLFGGYAHSFKKAWRIDYELLKFVEISTIGLSCGFDDDRN